MVISVSVTVNLNHTVVYEIEMGPKSGTPETEAPLGNVKGSKMVPWHFHSRVSYHCCVPCIVWAVGTDPHPNKAADQLTTFASHYK